MSKTETQSEALTAERRLFITAVANLELRKKFGDEGFRLDLERDELEALIEMEKRAGRLDAENKALRADAERYHFIKRHRLILSGGTEKFGWPIAPFGDECDRYIAQELAAERAPQVAAKNGGAA